MSQSRPSEKQLTESSSDEFSLSDFPLDSFPDDVLIHILSHVPWVDLVWAFSLINQRWSQLSKHNLLWENQVIKYFPSSLKYPSHKPGRESSFYLKIFKHRFNELFSYIDMNSESIKMTPPHQIKLYRLFFMNLLINSNPIQKYFSIRTKEEWEQIKKLIKEKIPNIEEKMPDIFLDDQRRISRKELKSVNLKVEEQIFIASVFSISFSQYRTMFSQDEYGHCYLDLVIYKNKRSKCQPILDNIFNLIFKIGYLTPCGLPFLIPFDAVDSGTVLRMRDSKRYLEQRNCFLWAAELNQIEFFKRYFQKKGRTGSFPGFCQERRSKFVDQDKLFNIENNQKLDINANPMLFQESIFCVSAFNHHNELFHYLLKGLTFISIDAKNRVLFSALQAAIYGDNKELFYDLLKENELSTDIFSRSLWFGLVSQFFLLRCSREGHNLDLDEMLIFWVDLLVEKNKFEVLKDLYIFWEDVARSFSTLSKEKQEEKFSVWSPIFNFPEIRTAFLCGLTYESNRKYFNKLFSLEEEIIFYIGCRFGDLIIYSLKWLDENLLVNMADKADKDGFGLLPTFGRFFYLWKHFGMDGRYKGFYCSLKDDLTFKFSEYEPALDFSLIKVTLNFDLLNILLIHAQYWFPGFREINDRFAKQVYAPEYIGQYSSSIFFEGSALLMARLIWEINDNICKCPSDIYDEWLEEVRETGKYNEAEQIFKQIDSIYKAVKIFLDKCDPYIDESEKTNLVFDNVSASSSAYAVNHLFANTRQNALPLVETVQAEEDGMEVDVDPQVETEEECKEPPIKKRKTQ